MISYLIFTTNNIGNNDTIADLFGSRNLDDNLDNLDLDLDNINNMDNNLDNNLNNDLDDTGYDSNGVASSSKGKRLMRFRNHLTKKLKLSLPKVFLERNMIKNEIKKKALDFLITKWEKEMEEKQR